jgi:transcriptional regulator with XRE-family HTH domain
LDQYRRRDEWDGGDGRIHCFPAKNDSEVVLTKWKLCWIQSKAERTAEKIGIVQTLVTDYENDRLRLTAEMAVRFAMALDVSLDELLHPKTTRPARKPSCKVLRRLEQIEALPPTQQTTLLRTIDTFLEVAALKTARR